MLIRWRVPKTIQWVLKLFFIMLLVFTLFRLSTYFAFSPEHISMIDVIPSFIMGVSYDIRWICIMLLPIVLSGYIPTFSPYSSTRARNFWTVYLAITTFIIIFLFGADYGHFAYVSTRLNASALNFVEDAHISFQMLWQSYPIFWILLIIIIVGYIFYLLYRRTHRGVEVKNSVTDTGYRRRWYVLATVFMVLGIYGSVTFKPLNWNDAFVLKDNFKAYLALNPLQNFYTTLGFREPEVIDQKAKEYYPVIREFLQIDSLDANKYDRWIYPGSRSLESKPNIVLVICESFSMYKSSMSGNPLNSTPYFNELTKQGIFFDRCFTPHFSTARGVFATLTGIPDVQLSKFSSRNEESLQQYTIINNFEEYEKFYFLGGSSEFNNYRGLLNNIHGLNRYEEGSYKSPKINVWGISDKDLFMESNAVLRERKKPFFAVIQTADNHRPYTLPTDDENFKTVEVDQDTLQKYGFLHIQEYNAFRYADYSINAFIEMAKKEAYFHNTIFVFVGDHGVAGNARAIYPRVWTEQRLSDEHVPLLFYAPGLLVPGKRTEVVSQIDVLPTIAGLVHQPYQNRTLGRDIFNPNKRNNGAFIIHHDQGKISWVTDSFYFVKNIRFDEESIYPVKSDQVTWTPQQEAEMKKKTSVLVSAFYETAKWMLVNNKP